MKTYSGQTRQNKERERQKGLREMEGEEGGRKGGERERETERERESEREREKEEGRGREC